MPTFAPADTGSLARRMLAKEYERGKLVNPKVLFAAIEAMGCPPPPPQSTECTPLDNGTFTCTTR
jgi:hypothetical protein